MAKNVLGQDLEICGCDPMTGFFRDGMCNTDHDDMGIHTVCCVVTDDFLAFSKAKGNDLMTPNLRFGFPGLKAGDSWCVCAGSWLEAYKEGHACKVKLAQTHEESLAIIPLKYLKEMAY